MIDFIKNNIAARIIVSVLGIFLALIVFMLVVVGTILGGAWVGLTLFGYPFIGGMAALLLLIAILLSLAEFV